MQKIIEDYLKDRLNETNALLSEIHSDEEVDFVCVVYRDVEFTFQFDYYSNEVAIWKVEKLTDYMPWFYDRIFYCEKELMPIVEETMNLVKYLKVERN